MFKGNVRGFFEFRVCLIRHLRGFFVEGRRKVCVTLSLSLLLSLSLSLILSNTRPD